MDYLMHQLLSWSSMSDLFVSVVRIEPTGQDPLGESLDAIGHASEKPSVLRCSTAVSNENA